MELVRGIVARVASLWRGTRRRHGLESEMLEEFRQHIELRAAALEREGLTSAEAARRARIEFGHVESHREAARAARGLRFLDEIGFSWLDVKLGVRMIRKTPGLSLVSVIGMAVAIAVGAGAFGFIGAIMDPVLPVPGGDRVLALQLATDNPGNPERRALHDFELWREELTSVRDVGAFRFVQRNAETPAGTRLVRVAEISAAGFRVAAAAPVLGRPLVDEDEQAGAPAVVVIAEETWRLHFGGDPAIVGRSLRLGERMHTVVGVMPAGYRFPLNDRYWVPLRLRASDYEVGDGPAIEVFGRLAEGATLARARAELAALGARMAAEHPGTHERLRPTALAYTRSFFDVDSPMIAFALHLAQAGISLLLIVVAVNVATLVYARTATRVGEIAVRSALGASRRRILAQLFAEAFVLSAIAAAVGVGLAGFGLEVFESFLSGDIGGELPYWFRVGLSPALLAYSVGLALIAGVIIGVVPGLKATGRRVQAQLQQLAGRGSQMRLGRVWTGLIVGQVAIAVAVLPFALFLASHSIERGLVRPSFATGDAVHAWVTFERDAGKAEADSVRDPLFVGRAGALLRRLETDPAVAGVAFGRRSPEEGVFERFEVENGPTLTMLANAVDVDAFEVIGVPIAAGRGFEPGDASGDPRAAIVTQELAGEIEGPTLGRRIRSVQSDPTGGAVVTGPWLDIVGVVPDFASPYDFEERPPRIYRPLALADTRSFALVLRTHGAPPPAFGGRLSAMAAAIDPRLQLLDVQTGAERLRASRQSVFAIAAIIVAVTASVLLLSAAGIYAMMSFTVARRRREIGIRSALGAAPRRLLAGIFARAAGQLGFGVLIGLLLAAGLGNSLLGTTLPDGVVWAPAVAAIILLIGLASALAPARRALAIQPTEVLRDE